MKITVLAGGMSPERDVSLTSGSLIANALINRGYEVALADVYVGLDDGADLDSLFTTEKYPEYHVSTTEPDLKALKESCGNRAALIGPRIFELCHKADAVFLALHGGIGENGMLQAALECKGIRHYTGTGFSGALVSMDKQLAKTLMGAAGVHVPHGITYDSKYNVPSDIIDAVGLPCVIKPLSCGSSCGVSRVYDEEELDAALKLAGKYEDKFIAEQLIIGPEFTCGVLDGVALPPVQIIPNEGWYDYANKYQKGATTEICPAPISREETDKIKRAAVDAFHALGMTMYGRADFIQDEVGEFWCLEVNALPGMTPTSLLPQEAAAVGISYEDLCEKLVKMALAK